MSVFGAYSRYYNLLYRDKDYAGEAEYIDLLIRKYRPSARTVLDLGCGTGRHDLLLARKGYRVTGVDLSEEMLAVARGQQSAAELELSFRQGDVRDVRVDDEFDVVVSLFHVMSYQVTNADLLAAFATARAHLKAGGIFIFDCWYGPAVLTDRPSVRIKRLEDEAISVTRLAEPVMHAAESIVDVNYQVYITEKAEEKVAVLNETHRMRYLFTPEVEHFLAQNGMKVLESAEWMTGREPGFDTWGVCFVAGVTD